MSRAVTYLQRTFFVRYVSSAASYRVMKTNKDSLGGSPTGRWKEYCRAGWQWWVPLLFSTLTRLYFFCDILRFSLSNLPNVIQCYSIRGRISTCHGFSCPSHRRIRHCKACSIVAMWSSILSERVSSTALCLPNNWNSLDQHHKMDYKWRKYVYILDHGASLTLSIFLAEWFLSNVQASVSSAAKFLADRRWVGKGRSGCSSCYQPSKKRRAIYAPTWRDSSPHRPVRPIRGTFSVSQQEQ